MPASWPAPNYAATSRPLLLASWPVALSFLWLGSAQAAPASPVPDFYQHQAWLPATSVNPNAPAGRNLWEGWNQADYVANGPLNAALNEADKNGKAGLCWQTSVVDALYPWTQFRDGAGANPFANLFGNTDITTAGKWVRASEDAVLGVRAAGGGINNYLNAQGFGPITNTGGVALTDTSFTVGAKGLLSVRLAGRTEATNFTPLAAATQSFNNGWTAVMRIETNPKPQPTLWWDTSFHAMAVAGVAGGQLLVADPDSVPRNAGNYNGGWWNFAAIKSAATLAAKNDAATASLAAAVAAVNANIYTNAQAAGPTPVPGVAGYTTANLYGTIGFDNAANRTNLITAASNAAYVNRTRMTDFDVINTLAVTRRTLAVAPPLNPLAGGFSNIFDWTGLISGDVRRIEIFPVEPLTDNNFTFTEPGWDVSFATTDPFGGVWSGGIDLSQTAAGSMLELGDTATITFDTLTPATEYNVFFQLTDGDWGVQAFGAEGNAFGDQIDTVNVPEPATFLLLGTSLAGLVLGRRRRAGCAASAPHGWSRRLAVSGDRNAIPETSA